MLPCTPDFEENIQRLCHEFHEHGIYTPMDDISMVRLFVKDHVFAVWVFMARISHEIQVFGPLRPGQQAGGGKWLQRSGNQEATPAAVDAEW